VKKDQSLKQPADFVKKTKKNMADVRTTGKYPGEEIRVRGAHAEGEKQTQVPSGLEKVGQVPGTGKRRKYDRKLDANGKKGWWGKLWGYHPFRQNLDLKNSDPQESGSIPTRKGKRGTCPARQKED